MSKRIAKLIIHCSASPDTRDIGVKEIREDHIKNRGFIDVAYQYVIRRDGTVEIGRPHNGDSILEGREIGAHAIGHNADSLGICVIGDKAFDPRQMLALVTLVRTLCRQHGLPPHAIFGHYELDKAGKTCPNFDVSLLRKAAAA